MYCEVKSILKSGAYLKFWWQGCSLFWANKLSITWIRGHRQEIDPRQRILLSFWRPKSQLSFSYLQTANQSMSSDLNIKKYRSFQNIDETIIWGYIETLVCNPSWCKERQDRNYNIFSMFFQNLCKTCSFAKNRSTIDHVCTLLTITNRTEKCR
jgi:hypothetical protein